MYYSWDSSNLSDILAAAFTYGVCRSLWLLSKELHNRGLLDVHLHRKLLHVMVGLVTMLCWPIFSCSWRGRILAGFVPSLCMIKGIAAGLKSQKDDQLVKFFKKYRNSRELLKAALGYTLNIAWVTIFYWRTPLAIAAICNLCAGDAMADIVGRRFGGRKLPYNKNKSFAGSIGMAFAGFFASILYMYYFSWLGYIQGSQDMVLGFLVVSVVSSLVESLPFNTKFDDNQTVPIASMLVGTFVL